MSVFTQDDNTGVSNFWHLKSVVCNNPNANDISHVKYITLIQHKDALNSKEINNEPSICFSAVNIYLNSDENNNQIFTYKQHNFLSDSSRTSRRGTIFSNEDKFREIILDKIPNESFPIINIFLSKDNILFNSPRNLFFYVKENDGGIKKLQKQQVEVCSLGGIPTKVNIYENEERIYNSLRVAMYSNKFYNIPNPNYELCDKFRDTYNISHSVIDDDVL